MVPTCITVFWITWTAPLAAATAEFSVLFTVVTASCSAFIAVFTVDVAAPVPQPAQAQPATAIRPAAAAWRRLNRGSCRMRAVGVCRKAESPPQYLSHQYGLEARGTGG